MAKPRRELGVIQVAALSLGLMAPTAAMALNGSLAASIAGTAVPLVFLFALVTIAFVAYAFVEFARQYATAGSVYTFNGVALGARIGFLSGWALLLTYVAFTVASAALAGVFFQSLTGLLGFAIPWYIPALVTAILLWVLATQEISLSTRATLIIEAISIVIIVILAVVVFARGGANGLSLKPFEIGTGGLPAVGLASVFAFLSFAGFESAATLGEETSNPKRAIPRALIAAVLTAGIFYVVITYMQSIGFGLGSAGVKAFAGSSGPLADLATKFVGAPMAVAITAGATVSSFASTIASATAASRLMVTFGRDGLLPAPVAKLNARHNAPVTAIGVIVIVTIISIIGFAIANVTGSNVFGYLGTIGVLSLLLVYLVTQVAAIVLFRRNRRWRALQFIIPIVAIALLGYALYANVYPIPAAPYNVFPYLVLAWIVIGIIVAIAKPESMKRASADLVAQGGQVPEVHASDGAENKEGVR